VGALRTRAERRGDRWVLTGKKIWITNGGIADLITVFATEDPALSTKGITGFLVEGNARGLRREKMPGKELGHRGSDHAALLLDGVEVPDSAVFGTRKQGFKVAMDGLFHGRISVAAGAVGCHRAALEACLQFARSRQQFGKTLGEFQMVQERIADMATELEAARLLVRRCALMMEAGTCTPVELAMAKLYATEAAFRAAEQAVLLHGGRGYSSAYPVERLMRDVMGMRIYEGTTLIQKTIIARKLLG
jgi:alkylation response protein AidB-like acyl-CoA dehydrogenase